MALTAHDIQRLSSSHGHLHEVVAASATAAYSKVAFPRNRLLKLEADDGCVVKFCHEYLWGNRFGAGDTPGDLDADELFDGIRHGEAGDLLDQYWDVSNVVTNTPFLNKTAHDSGQSHALEFPLADTDDVIDAWLTDGKRTRYGRNAAIFNHAQLKNSHALQLTIDKQDLFYVTATNNKVDVVGSISGAYTATLTVGTYSWTELAAELKTQLEAGSTGTFTISLVANVVRVAFDTENHSFDWATSTDPIGAMLGFTADDGSGAGPFDADEAQNLDILEYSLREYRHSETNPVRSWDGTTWQNGATSWVDITGPTAGIVTRFIDSITLSTDTEQVVDTVPAQLGDVGHGTASTATGYKSFIRGPSTYRIFIRPKADVADKAVLIENIGIHEVITATDADTRLAQNDSSMYRESLHWMRVGVIADNASKNLWISEMGRD
jgi:hypothetical protein